MVPVLLLLVLPASPAGTVLSSSQLVATLDPAHGLVQLAAPGQPAHVFGAGTDGWSVGVSSFNSSAQPFELSSQACKLAKVSAGGQHNATFSYQCKAAGFRVEIEYELREGWAFIKKHIRACKCAAGTSACADTWTGTIQSVSHWGPVELQKAHCNRRTSRGYGVGQRRLTVSLRQL